MDLERVSPKLINKNKAMKRIVPTSVCGVEGSAIGEALC